MTTTNSHKLKCDDAPLPRGVRKERSWSCSCGEWKTFGFDAPSKRAHKEHVAR